MQIQKLFLLTAFVLFMVVGTMPAYGETNPETESAASSISQQQLGAYIQVTRITADNPEMSSDEMLELLQKHKLSKREFESIELQVQANPELKKKVEQGLQEESRLEEEPAKAEGVKAKLKEPAKQD